MRARVKLKLRGKLKMNEYDYRLSDEQLQRVHDILDRNPLLSFPEDRKIAFDIFYQEIFSRYIEARGEEKLQLLSDLRGLHDLWKQIHKNVRRAA